MASNTKMTEHRRKIKTRNQNLDRKKKLERDGSTPKFPIHLEKPAGK
jgi:hypothetical protein